jgi:hypothetical protein
VATGVVIAIWVLSLALCAWLAYGYFSPRL